MRSLVTSLVAGTRMRDAQLGGGPDRFETIVALLRMMRPPGRIRSVMVRLGETDLPSLGAAASL
ncbi:MAG: hypothetical protein FJX57_09935 [Alphaproteobacteria bacterium]|nr:hypothetical protein [Alphaproteobacteria bacterium]